MDQKKEVAGAGEEGESGTEFANSGKDKAFDNQKMWDMIQAYQEELDRENDVKDKIRVVVRDVDNTVKKVNFTLMEMHEDPSLENLRALAKKGQEILDDNLYDRLNALVKLVPKGEHYKYNDMWRSTIQRLAAVACLLHFLKTDKLLTVDECTEMLRLRSVGSKSNDDPSIYLGYDDYLAGLLEMAGEISRLCRNCVTFGGSLTTVYAIKKVMNQMNTGMHQITFKNDYLRKRYDTLKYNLKNVEEVVYDSRLHYLMEEAAERRVAAGTSGQGNSKDCAISDGQCPTSQAEEEKSKKESTSTS